MEIMRDKRILIISHNPFSNNNNMGKTLSNLFYEFSRENVIQLYLRPDEPYSDKFDKYYCVNDFDMMKSFFSSANHGKITYNRSDKTNNKEDSKKSYSFKDILYKIGSRKSPIIYLLRDYIWKKKYWKSKSLMSWINKFNPEVIFYASGESRYSFKIAADLADTLKIPIATYFCDDFYFYRKFSLSPFYYIYINNLKKSIQKIIKKSSQLIYISESMETTYNNKFNKSGHIIMTPSPLKYNSNYIKKKNSSIIISYLGNINLRIKPLLEMGEAIKSFNNEMIKFNLYSRSKSKSDIKNIKSCKGINFKDSIDFKDIEKIIQQSDILLHVESFSKRMISRTKHSISTKIPEILSMRKCLFAYGPKEIASISYLINNDCACVCTDRTELKNKLLILIKDKNLRNEYGEKGLAIAIKNHSAEINSQKLKDILNDTLRQ